MNFYERHIGDFIKDTMGLTMIEDGAYNRLLDVYYATEEPLPLDLKECYLLARAISKKERDAVDKVLLKFFQKTDDGFRKNRCDEVIEKYQKTIPESDKKKENAKERQQRARERRKALFQALSKHGITMPYDATTADLEAELSRIITQPVTHDVTQPVTRDNTATNTHYPIPNINPSGSVEDISHTSTSTDDPPQTEHPKTGIFPMYAEWLVSKTFASLCKSSGISDALLTDDNLREFRTYWLTQPQKMRTQTEWEHALIKSIKSAMLRGGTSPPSKISSRESGRTMAARSIGFGVDDKQLPQRIEKEVTGEKLE